MNNEKNTNFTLLFSYSCILHTLVLAVILVSLYDQNLTQHSTPAQIIIVEPNEKKPNSSFSTNKKETPPPRPETSKNDDVFKVPLPVMYYGNTLDKNRRPGGSANSLIISQPKEYEFALIGATPSEKTPNSEGTLLENHGFDAMPAKEKLISSSTNTTEKVLAKPDISSTTKFSSSTKAKTSLTTSRKIVKSLFPQRASAGTTKAKGVINSLSQLVSTNSPSSSQAQATYNPVGFSSHDGEGYGQHVVIKDGDIRYYSVWRKFLHHINQTAQYNKIKNKRNTIEYTQPMRIKDPCWLVITIKKDGTCTGVAVTHSSGSETFDKFNVETAWSGSPYPPLPDSMPKDCAQFEVVCW